MSEVNLPAIVDESVSALEKVTAALGVPRSVIASDAEIKRVWEVLPQLISRIPLELRGEMHVRMCIAVAAGLFDAAINYVWNSAITALRDRVRDFGLHIVPQITGQDFDEQKLLDLRDADLLGLCLSLNLISEDAFFFLDQCRDVRNNFSSAHPPMGSLDDYEFVAFLNRCVRYALSSTSNPRGVDTRALIQAVKGPKHSQEQRQEWMDRIAATHEAQQELIFLMLHGIYCDASSPEEARVNAIAICENFAPQFSPKTKSELINRHSDYIAQGRPDRQVASQTFFEKLGILGLLTEQEQHALISKACRQLLAVHQDWLNFYNEPPFAERLLEISKQVGVPTSAKTEFVTAVVTCAVGNRYGVSHAASPYYKEMVENFSPMEIAIMLDLPNTQTILGGRLKDFPVCWARFGQLVRLLDPKSIPTPYVSKHAEWVGS